MGQLDPLQHLHRVGVVHGYQATLKWQAKEDLCQLTLTDDRCGGRNPVAAAIRISRSAGPMIFAGAVPYLHAASSIRAKPSRSANARAIWRITV